jgi:hypothetical protein
MFVLELEDWARQMGRDAALAFAPIAASDPMGGFRWISSISAQVSGMDRAYPTLGLYSIYLDASNRSREAF